MSKLIALAGACAIFAASAHAATPADEDHSAHHPENAASAAKPAPSQPAAPASRPAASQGGMRGGAAGMDMQMQAMREMHGKMMAATPEGRQALMADHMKVMKDGMAMTGPARNMEERMEMMESMMQMMMDRMDAMQPK